MLTATTDAFLAAWKKHNGHTPSVAAELGLQIRSVFARRASLERMGYDLPAGETPRDNLLDRMAYTSRHVEQIEDGTAVVFGDRHWWPGDGVTAAEAALLALPLALSAAVFYRRPTVTAARGMFYGSLAYLPVFQGLCCLHRVPRRRGCSSCRPSTT
jgi:hypothetical protein